MQPDSTETDQVLIGPARDLSLLLDASNALSSSRNLEEVSRTLSQKLTESVESTNCRIYLLEESDSHLTICGFWALRDLDWESGIGRTYPVDSLHWHFQAVTKRQHIVISRHNSEIPVLESEYSVMFPPETRSVLLMPLVVKDTCLGVATLGEMRSWERSPFTQAKIELCRAMARQGALAIENIRAFDSIANQNRATQLILNSVTDGVFSTDADGRILVFNPSAEKMTGYLASEMIGHTCSDKFLGRDSDGCKLCGSQCPIQQILKSSEEARPQERHELITRFDGTKIAVLHSVAPLLNQSNQVIGTVSVIRDVSRQQELNRLKSEFISLVSHQLRTPLATISASAELLATSNLDKTLEKEMLQTLNEQCKRLSELTNQVLEASRLEKGRIELVLEPLTLAPLIQQTVGVYQSLYTDHRIRIEMAPITSFVLGDHNSVKIVIENLLQNALNYSPLGSTINLSAEEKDDVTIISVSDQGVGIQPDEIDDIFLPFHRALNQKNQQRRGFGLGLYIVKTLVMAQGGTIWVESEPGRGSRFHFTLKKVRDS